MRWTLEHPLEADVDALLAVALDDATLADIPRYMPLVASVTRAERRILDDGRVLLVDRYEPGFDPPPFARGLTREMLGWDLRLTWNLATRCADFVIDPHVKPEWKRHADARGTYRFERRGEGRAARVLEGTLDIKVALVGTVAERFAVRQLRQQFEGEARLLAARAAARGLRR